MHGERLNDGLSMFTTGDGPPLVLLPGLGAGADLSVAVPRSATWTARPVATGQRRTVHLIHRPVDMPVGTTIAELAGWYGAALRTRFDGPVDVMGTSAGGVTALQLAMDHPEVVRRLVVCVAASRVGDRGRRDLMRTVELGRQGRGSAWLGSGLVARGPLRLLAFAAFALAGRTPRTVGEAAFVEAAQTWDVTGRLGEITAPTLVIAGTRDQLIPTELAEATAAGIPNARLVLRQGRGHLTAASDRGATRMIREFLTS